MFTAHIQPVAPTNSDEAADRGESRSVDSSVRQIFILPGYFPVVFEQTMPRLLRNRIVH